MPMLLVAISPYPGSVHLRATMDKWEATGDSGRQPIRSCFSLLPLLSYHRMFMEVPAYQSASWKYYWTDQKCLLLLLRVLQAQSVVHLLVIRKKDEAFLALWFLASWLFLSTWMIFFHFLSRSGWSSVKYFYFFITLCVVRMSLLMKRTKSGVYHQILHLTDLA